MQKEKQILKKRENIQKLCDNFKRCNVSLIATPEEEQSELSRST